MRAKVEGVRTSRTTADVRNPKVLTPRIVGANPIVAAPGVGDREEGKNKDGAGEQHIEEDREWGGGR